MNIESVQSLPAPDWLRMRLSLWQDTPVHEHLAEMHSLLSQPQRFVQFMARSPSGTALGFAEASLRTDYVNGTESSPVAFLEGLYVEPEARRQGVARALVDTVATWARTKGCRELASDTQLENLQSQAVHAQLGFTETDRVVCFNRALGPTQDA
jgi:aminoglycoside 6'-N-acetyltransferase I